MITQRQTKAEATKQRIIDAALRLFAEKGVDATTTRDIASRAKIAEGTIYRHFESKEQMAQELFEGKFIPLSKELTELSRLEGTALEKIERTVIAFYRAFDEDPVRWAYIMTYQGGPWSKVKPSVMTPVRLMSEVLSTGVKRGEFDVKDIRITTQILMGIIEHPALGIVYQELSAPLSNYKEEVIAAIRRVLGA